jgi:hypothetical protein
VHRNLSSFHRHAILFLYLAKKIGENVLFLSHFERLSDGLGLFFTQTPKRAEKQLLFLHHKCFAHFNGE